MQAYLDNSATTVCEPGVVDKVVQMMNEVFGNPSAMHNKGVEAENYVKEAKEIIAKTMKVQEKEILFTSGGTESNNLAIMGCAAQYRDQLSRRRQPLCRQPRRIMDFS